jgi:hypothetical protein
MRVIKNHQQFYRRCSMNKNILDSKLTLLVEEYIDKFIEIPPIFCSTLTEIRKKEILHQALLTNKPIENVQTA